MSASSNLQVDPYNDGPNPYRHVNVCTCDCYRLLHFFCISDEIDTKIHLRKPQNDRLGPLAWISNLDCDIERYRNICSGFVAEAPPLVHTGAEVVSNVQNNSNNSNNSNNNSNNGSTAGSVAISILPENVSVDHSNGVNGNAGAAVSNELKQAPQVIKSKSDNSKDDVVHHMVPVKETIVFHNDGTASIFETS
jgi:hypothetical protein